MVSTLVAGVTVFLDWAGGGGVPGQGEGPRRVGLAATFAADPNLQYSTDILDLKT